MDRFFKRSVYTLASFGAIASFSVVLLSPEQQFPSVSVGSQQATVAFSNTDTVNQPQPPAPLFIDHPDSNALTMVFVGDIMLSRDIGKTMAEQDDWTYPFEYVKDYLQNADLAFGNLEGPISGRGKNQGSIYSFNADPFVISGLTDAGFDVMSVANNHIFDYGRDAFLDTLALLKISGIDAVGGGVNFEDAHRPVVHDVKGTKVAFLGYTNLYPRSFGDKNSVPAISYLDEGVMKHDIEIAKTLADIVVVSFHWGDEYETKHNAWQERIAREAIDAGASLVIGHHPHVVQEVEEYRGAYIAYSLGNFIFDQNFSEDTGRGLILEVKINNKKIGRVRALGVSFNSSFQPSIMN